MVDRELILKLENLSHLELSEDDRISMQIDLQSMIQMINKLQEIDTAGLDPMVHLGTNESLLREDVINDQLLRVDALSNASAHDEEYFLVPKVIEK